MNELTIEQQAFFDTLRAEFARQVRSFIYDIVHEMNITPGHLFVSTKLTPQAMCGLIAYIELFAFELTSACSYSLEEKEVMEIINKFYTDVRYLKATPCKEYHEIDLYWNWEYHSSFPYVLGMPEWYREGLLDYIKEMSIRNNWRKA